MEKGALLRSFRGDGSVGDGGFSFRLHRQRRCKD